MASSSPDHLKRLLQSADAAPLQAYVNDHAAKPGFHLELFHIYRHNEDDLALRRKAAELQLASVPSRLAEMIPEFGQGSVATRREMETLAEQVYAFVQSAECPEELKSTVQSISDTIRAAYRQYANACL